MLSKFDHSFEHEQVKRPGERVDELGDEFLEPIDLVSSRDDDGHAEGAVASSRKNKKNRKNRREEGREKEIDW